MIKWGVIKKRFLVEHIGFLIVLSFIKPLALLVVTIFVAQYKLIFMELKLKINVNDWHGL